MKRITLDLDDCNKEYAFLRIHQLLTLGCSKVFVRKSSGGEGYHLEARIDTEVNEYMLRTLMGDDVKRIQKDLKQSFGNILADQKGEKSAGAWKVYK